MHTENEQMFMIVQIKIVYCRCFLNWRW